MKQDTWDIVDFIKTKEEILFNLTMAFETDDLRIELAALDAARHTLEALYKDAGTTTVVAPDCSDY